MTFQETIKHMKEELSAPIFSSHMGSEMRVHMIEHLEELEKLEEEHKQKLQTVYDEYHTMVHEIGYVLSNLKDEERAVITNIYYPRFVKILKKFEALLK